jgi:hypothetical protein
MSQTQDVESVDAIIKALYDVISGPAGPKDWARERHLFHPGARLMRGSPPDPGPAGPGQTPGLSIMTSEEFIATVAPRLAVESFYEIETGREEFRFGRWVHAVSAYVSHRRLEDPPYARGINSIQLWFDSGRWWIMNVLWDWETGDVVVPAKLR